MDFDEMESAVVTLTDALRDALAAADDDALQAAAGAFAEQYEEAETADVVSFLKELAALAEGAVAHGHRLYCQIVW
ncbi:hypothetical protein [Amycolatopsis benzoatilytica]|uniref:hypothetical protein n=1 Tax=Amycolatopsis benzoatilytica TaxID=346045 RepID=UPI00039E5A70|nr:hypothetical protein [Amycolatopsis benzoatilytica]